MVKKLVEDQKKEISQALQKHQAGREEMKGETKKGNARLIIISIALIIVSICVAIPSDKRIESKSGRRRRISAISADLYFKRLEMEWEAGTGVRCIRGDSSACFANKFFIKIKLEEYKQQYGFYPSEANWDAFLVDPSFWPDYPGPRFCTFPISYPYKYQSDSFPGSVLVTNEHGSGYSKYRMACTNPACQEHGKPEYGE
jgi:hypothetical protein